VTQIILIEAKFNKFLSDAIAMEAKQQGIEIDLTLDAGSDEAAKYRPSVVPCLMAVHPCGCKILEFSDPIDVIIFDPEARRREASPCACTRRKIAMIRARIIELIAQRHLEIELWGDIDILAAIATEIGELRDELAKLEGKS